MDKRLKDVDHRPKCHPQNNWSSTYSCHMTGRSAGRRKFIATPNKVPRPLVRRSFHRTPSQQDRQDPQFFWRNNLKSAQTTVTLANRWIVNLLHILLETVRAAAASRRLPNLHFLEYLPVFQSIQGPYIRKPLYRQNCFPGRMKDEEDAMKKKQGVTQSSIKELLEELTLLRNIYNKQATPEVTPRIRDSNPPDNNKRVSYVDRKVMYIDLASPVRNINSEDRVVQQ